jgi:hypothetical protein
MADWKLFQPLLARYFGLVGRSPDTRSEPHPMDATHLPTWSTCSLRRLVHLAECTPCRTRSQIRELKYLAELQGTLLDQTAIDDRAVLAQSGLLWWKLRADADLLCQQLETALLQAPECPESVPQTESDLERDRR